jgi:hypothetical protein
VICLRSPALALFFGCLACGCAATTVYSGLPPDTSPKHFDLRWHPAFLFGTIDGAEPYDLARVCPGGWSEIILEPDPFTVLAGVLTLFIYSPTRMSVVCAAPSSH